MILQQNVIGARKDPSKDLQINLIIDNPMYQNDICKYELIPYTESNFNQISNTGSEMILIDIPLEYVMRITDIEKQSYIEIGGNYKIFVINFNKNNFNYKLVIRSELSNLNDNFYIHKDGYYSGFRLDISNSTTKFIIDGKCKIIKDIDGKTNKIFFEIDRINNIKCNIKEFANLTNFNISKFNFQEAYDRLKQTNNKCPESTILFKYIYNSFYTQKLIDNYNHWSLIHNNLGKIFELELITNIETSGEKIIDICSDTNKRQVLLKNTMKRIETTNKKGFLIKNNTNTFVPIESLRSPVHSLRNFEIIFDTGNSAICMININFVNALGLTPKKTFKISTQGTTGDTIDNNEYVDIELKLDPSLYNIDIAKTFKFRAYVQHRGLDNTLLLGQSAYSLKQFFDESYCIGFNTSKQDYEKSNLDNNTHLEKYEEYYKSILKEIETLYFTRDIKRFILQMRSYLNLLSILKPISNIVQHINDSQMDRIQILYNDGKKIKEKYEEINRNTSIPKNAQFNKILEDIKNIILSNI